MAFHLLTQDQPINTKAKQAQSKVNMYTLIKLMFMIVAIIYADFKLSWAAGFLVLSAEREGAAAKNKLNVLYQRFMLL